MTNGGCPSLASCFGFGSKPADPPPPKSAASHARKPAAGSAPPPGRNGMAAAASSQPAATYGHHGAPRKAPTPHGAPPEAAQAPLRPRLGDVPSAVYYPTPAAAAQRRGWPDKPPSAAAPQAVTPNALLHERERDPRVSSANGERASAERAPAMSAPPAAAPAGPYADRPPSSLGSQQQHRRTPDAGTLERHRSAGQLGSNAAGEPRWLDVSGQHTRPAPPGPLEQGAMMMHAASTANRPPSRAASEPVRAAAYAAGAPKPQLADSPHSSAKSDHSGAPSRASPAPYTAIAPQGRAAAPAAQMLHSQPPQRLAPQPAPPQSRPPYAAPYRSPEAPKSAHTPPRATPPLSMPGNLPPLAPPDRRSAPPVHTFNDPLPPSHAPHPRGANYSSDSFRARSSGSMTTQDDSDPLFTSRSQDPQTHVVRATPVPPRPTEVSLVRAVMDQAHSVTNALDHMTDAMGEHHTAGKQVKKIKLLGKGGFGTVYLATMDGGKQKIALKELSAPLEYRPYSQSPSEVLGTLREAAIQALMVHTNIVRTYWADVSVVHPHTGKPLGLNFSSIVGANMQGHVVEDCTPDSQEVGGAPQAEWLSVEGLIGGTKRLAEKRELPELVGLNVRIAMEYCELGSLIDYVFPRSKGAKVVAINMAIGNGMEQTLCAALTALDIARGLKLLHRCQIVHGDLKPHNILIAADPESKEKDAGVQDPRGFVAKLSDFGLSKHMRRGETEVNGITHGSVEYMPLEALQSRTVTKASDVYAFGIIMWELWHNDCWAPHYKAKQAKRRAAGHRGANMMKNIVPECWPQCPQEYASIVSDCLDRDPQKRPRIAQVARRLELFIDKRLFPEKPQPNDTSPFTTTNTDSTGPATTFGI